MFSQLFRQTFRNFLRLPVVSTIHILGLSIGFTVCGIIAIFIIEELSFDKYHDNYENIYRVIEVNRDGTNDQAWLPYVAASYGPQLQEQIPEVEISARIFGIFDWSVEVDDETQVVNNLVAADGDIFNILTLPILRGHKKNIFATPDEVAISQSIANRFFNDENPIGKTIIFDGNRPKVVSIVFEDIPENSHLNFEIILPINNFTEDPEWDWIHTWYTSSITYVKLLPGTNPDDLEDRMNKIMWDLLPDQQTINTKLQSLSAIHLYSKDIKWDYANHRSNISYVYLFSAIGIGVLLLACTNFINLATSRSLQRAPEVAMRKVLGATHRQLTQYYLFESILIALISVPIAIFFMEIVIPFLKPVVERQLPNIFLELNLPILIFAGLAAFTGILAGIYPALLLASYQASKNIRDLKKSNSDRGLLRKTLVSFQFVISLLLILVTGMINLQVHYMEKQPLGFNKDQMLIVRVADESNQTDFIPMREEFINDPGVVSASLSQVVPGIITAEDHVIPDGWTGENPITINQNIVCEKFIQTMGLEIIEGRDFDVERQADMLTIIINETAKRTFGWDSIEGKTVKGSSGRVFPVTGVVKDYHFMSLHKSVEPQMIVYYPKRGEILSILLKEKDMQETLKRLNNIWQKHIPNRPFNYSFLDESIGQWYTNEENLAFLLTIFSGLAVFISCLGIFGLVGHATQRRKFEIGMRKVLGASSASIMKLIQGEFLLLVVIANFLSWPIAFWINNQWSNHFAFRAPVAWWLFPVAGLLTMLLVLIVTGTITWRAANLNPVESIREE